MTWLTYHTIQYQESSEHEMINIWKGVPGWGRDESATIQVGNGASEPLISPFYYAEHGILVTGFNHESIYFGVSPDEASTFAPENYYFKVETSTWMCSITVACEYKGTLCGILGNFNDDMSDDWINGITGEVMIRPGGSRQPSNTPLWDATLDYGN